MNVPVVILRFEILFFDAVDLKFEMHFTYR